ncbi:MAG: C-terminal binding protein [Actinomycetota bacterium]
MSRFKVVTADQVFPDVGIERKLFAEIDASLEVSNGTTEDLLARGADADAILTTYFPIPAATIAVLKRCKVIAKTGIGTDNIDVRAAKEAGIVVTNVPDYCVEEVADHTLALLLALLRKIPEGDALVKSGGWGLLRPIARLSELTVGLVGYGKIARRLGSSLTHLGMGLLVHDPYLSPAPGLPPLVPLEELLRSADAVSLHAPLTSETSGLIGAQQLALMSPQAVLVNTSRGGLIVQDELFAALRAGTIRGAALDVFDTEPMDPQRFAGVPGLIATPHIAYYSEAAFRECQTKAATQIVKVLKGEKPDYQVNP